MGDWNLHQKNNIREKSIRKYDGFRLLRKCFSVNEHKQSNLRYKKICYFACMITVLILLSEALDSTVSIVQQETCHVFSLFFNLILNTLFHENA